MSEDNFILGPNCHGKGRVRLLKLHRQGERHDFVQLTAQVNLEGDMDSTFKHADNSKIVATDTVKNTVHVLARRNHFSSLEEFAILIGRHFLRQYPEIVSKVDVVLMKDLWTRVVTKDSHGRMCEHNHAFMKVASYTPFTHVIARRSGSGQPIEVVSGVRNLMLLKTTQSAFEAFHSDEYRSLPNASDRILGTALDGEWRWNQSTISSRPDYESLNKEVLDTIVSTFSGPADKGVFSPSVQATLYEIGTRVLSKTRPVDNIELYMPNIHNSPVDFSKLQIVNKDHTGKPDVFLPTDEPHGMIRAQLSRRTLSHL